MIIVGYRQIKRNEIPAHGCDRLIFVSDYTYLPETVGN
jgi:hypothetical protein